MSRHVPTALIEAPPSQLTGARTSLNGATVASALVQLESYVNGMAAVVMKLIPLSCLPKFMHTSTIEERSWFNK